MPTLISQNNIEAALQSADRVWFTCDLKSEVPKNMETRSSTNLSYTFGYICYEKVFYNRVQGHKIVTRFGHFTVSFPCLYYSVLRMVVFILVVSLSSDDNIIINWVPIVH